MAVDTDPHFLTFHALRIKGFAKAEMLAELAALALDDVERSLRLLADTGHAAFREARAVWQLTPDGRAAHAEMLVASVGPSVREALARPYGTFLGLNERFKALCGDWQLRDGQPNDHNDDGYDHSVVKGLAQLDRDARPVVDEFGGVVARFGWYSARLERTCQRVMAGERNMFTGVMCGSYHDVWMELHEDLILTQNIDRAAEGSF